TANEQIARVVVSNVTVLTAGTRYDQEEAKAGKPVRSTVVTLLVEPQDAEKVALAQTEGTILLTLRNPLDTTTSPTSGVKLTSLLGAAPTVTVSRPAVVVRSAAAPAAIAPAPKVYTVEAIRAAKRTEEKVR